ncbi:hypothetical protein AVEN_78067-1 [Araneus ventricosus]|uniref:Uncharacterized protein n=1 Tax=Araneus ventricosus TaxID=182803 RepID=A0A4Y1ZN73_ARAVE|nr:hypothetical protein AVEN_78067-1 [Araneus ventricosus]
MVQRKCSHTSDFVDFVIFREKPVSVFVVCLGFRRRAHATSLLILRKQNVAFAFFCSVWCCLGPDHTCDVYRGSNKPIICDKSLRLRRRDTLRGRYVGTG